MIVVATHRLFIGSLVFSWLVLCLLPVSASSAPYFEDGYLGLTQTELHDKLGLPQAARDRKAALRVFKYYSYADWQKYFKKLISPQNGEDVYTFKRDGVEVRYSFGFVTNPNDHSDEPTLYVNLVDVEFSQPVPISQVPALVPEFRPPSEADAPAFIKEYVEWGAGPRASQYLVLGAKARALTNGRYHVSFEDIRALAHPVLRHRVLTNFHAQSEGITTDQLVDRLLETVPLPRSGM